MSEVNPPRVDVRVGPLKIDEVTGPFIHSRAAEVERRILEGADRFEVIDKIGDYVIGRCRFEVPRWRRHPINRARIAWARFRYRRR